MDRFRDVDRLRLPAQPGSTPPRHRSRLPRHQRGERFLKGPIPWSWLAQAARQPGRALHVALVLWFWAGIKGRVEVPMPTTQVRSLGVSRYAAYRGLAALEKAGLVEVRRHRGRTPLVTILNPPQAVSPSTSPPTDYAGT